MARAAPHGYDAAMDWTKAYSNVDAIPGAADYPPRWEAEAAAFRAAHASRARFDQPSGPRQRQRFDLFLPGDTPTGLAIFVHGGYWMKFGKDWFSPLAGGALARGWAVAVPGYTLCPEVRIADITAEIGQAITAAASQIPGPIALAGHSAGGHLVTRMVCRDSPLDPGIRTRIAHVVSISGVHDLRPLIETAMNEGLRLELAEAAVESPALNTPLPGTSLTCWVGADELPEFVRQNALLANIWTGLGARTRCVEDPARHHFNVIDGLTDPRSPLTAAWLGEE